MTQPIPEGYSTVTACLAPENCADTIELYKKAFDAQENPKDRTQCPETGRIMHTVIQIGDTKIMMSDKFPTCPSVEGASFYVYVKDCDAAIERAKQAGLDVMMPPTDMFWGDRLGAVKDKCGIQWSIATHVRDVSEEELKKGAAEMARQMKSGQQAA